MDIGRTWGDRPTAIPFWEGSGSGFDLPSRLEVALQKHGNDLIDLDQSEEGNPYQLVIADSGGGPPEGVPSGLLRPIFKCRRILGLVLGVHVWLRYSNKPLSLAKVRAPAPLSWKT